LYNSEHFQDMRKYRLHLITETQKLQSLDLASIFSTSAPSSDYRL